MKIKMPKFTMKLACKYLSESLTEEFGFNTCVKVNDLWLETKGTEYRVHMDADISADKKGVNKYVKSSIKSSIKSSVKKKA